MEDNESEKSKCKAGAPPWVMTFADLMTLLMTFFVLLLSFSEIEVSKFKQIAGSMEKAFGVQRQVTANESPMGVSIIAQEFSPGKPQPTPVSEVRQTTTVELPNLALLKSRVIKEGKGEQENSANQESAEDTENPELIARMAAKLAKSEASMREIDEAIAEIIVKAKQDRKSMQYSRLLIQRLKTEVADGLISIETKEESVIIRIKEKGSFGSGEATLKEDFYHTMERITEEIADIPGRITISGHTDNVPIKTHNFNSNWELSAARAISVLNFMVNSGLFNPANMEVISYADTQPLVPNDSPKNRALNRRVDIKILPLVKLPSDTMSE